MSWIHTHVATTHFEVSGSYAGMLQKIWNENFSFNESVIRPCISKFGCHLLFRSVPLRWNYMLIKSHSLKSVAFYEYF